jgi:membrane protease YdiL (CAAX protease family)
VGLLACLIGAALGRAPWQSIQWRPDAAIAAVIATLPLLLALAWLVQSRWPPLARLTEIVARLVTDVFAGASWLELGVISLLAGIGEELMFRGLVQDLIASAWGPWAGLLLASLLFGLAHPISVTYAIVAAMMGLYLGCLYVSSGNLLVPIITHALYDFLALVWLNRRLRDES